MRRGCTVAWVGGTLSWAQGRNLGGGGGVQRHGRGRGGGRDGTVLDNCGHELALALMDDFPQSHELFLLATNGLMGSLQPHLRLRAQELHRRHLVPPLNTLPCLARSPVAELRCYSKISVPSLVLQETFETFGRLQAAPYPPALRLDGRLLRYTHQFRKNGSKNIEKVVKRNSKGAKLPKSGAKSVTLTWIQNVIGLLTRCQLGTLLGAFQERRLPEGFPRL